MKQLSWSEVTSRLMGERDVWVGTTGPDGRPHASPVWAVIVRDAIYFFSGRTTVKARNLERDPRLVLHAPSGLAVTIVHGTAVDLGHPASQPTIMAAFVDKYDDPQDAEYLPLDPAVGRFVLYRLDPTEAYVWELSDFDGSQRRWSS